MKILPILLSLTLILSSCHKHEELIAPEDYYEYGDINKLFNYNLEDIKVIEPFDAEKGLKYAINDKAEINIPAGCLVTTTNKKATGKAELTLIEIYDRGTMLITNKHTTARPYFSPDETGEYISQNAGIYYIKTTQGGSELKIESCSPTLITPPITPEISSNDQFLGEHEGILDAQLNIGWFNMRFPENNYIQPILNIQNFGWNALFLTQTIKNPETYTKTTFIRPSELNDLNSRIFIAPQGQKSRIGSINSKIKIKEKAHYILTVANKNSDGFLYTIKQSQTVVENQNITFTKEELKPATSEELKEIINALP